MSYQELQLSSSVSRIFDSIAIWADIFHNHLYDAAKNNKLNNKNDNDRGIDDYYIDVIRAYVYTIKTNEKTYKGTIKGLYTVYKHHMSLDGYTTAQYIEVLTSIFVPEDYYRQMLAQHKHSVLQEIINNVVDKMQTYMTRPDILKRTLTNRNKLENMGEYQDQIKDFLVEEKYRIYNKFLVPEAEHQYTDLLEKMKTIMKEKIREKVEIEKQNTELREIINNLQIKLSKYEGIDGTVTAGGVVNVPQQLSTRKKSSSNSSDSGSDNSNSSESGSSSSESNSSDSSRSSSRKHKHKHKHRSRDRELDVNEFNMRLIEIPQSSKGKPTIVPAQIILPPTFTKPLMAPVTTYQQPIPITSGSGSGYQLPPPIQSSTLPPILQRAPPVNVQPSTMSYPLLTNNSLSSDQHFDDTELWNTLGIKP